MDQAEQAMYEERMKQVADFDSLFDAREYVRGPFCKMIMEEFESRKE